MHEMSAKQHLAVVGKYLVARAVLVHPELAATAGALVDRQPKRGFLLSGRLPAAWPRSALPGRRRSLDVAQAHGCTCGSGSRLPVGRDNRMQQLSSCTHAASMSGYRILFLSCIQMRSCNALPQSGASFLQDPRLLSTIRLSIVPAPQPPRVASME